MVAANAGQADWGHWVAFAPWVSPLITSHPPEWLRGSGSLHSPTLSRLRPGRPPASAPVSTNL